MNVAALIMAGGSGERFGPESPKQLAMLDGRPMLAWSVVAFARSTRVHAIVLVGPADAERDLRAAISGVDSGKARSFVAGGATRQQSVFNGLQSLPDGTTHVLIHDAARPCVTDALRDRVLDALGDHDAVIPAVPVTDTLVRRRDDRVEAVVARDDVAGVQTPQGFRADLILRAHRTARDNGLESSDDGSLVLALGEPVFTVPGERTNVKVTFRDDIAVAEAILKNGVV